MSEAGAHGHEGPRCSKASQTLHGGCHLDPKKRATHMDCRAVLAGPHPGPDDGAPHSARGIPPGTERALRKPSLRAFGIRGAESGASRKCQAQLRAGCGHHRLGAEWNNILRTSFVYVNIMQYHILTSSCAQKQHVCTVDICD